MTTRFPPIVAVLPHAGRIVLLTRILDHTETETTCEGEVTPHSLFAKPDGTIPPWIGLEYMAQCIAAHAGLRAWIRGEPIKPGFFIGSRRVDFWTDGFRVGQVLRVMATHLWGEKELASFACTLRDGLTNAPLAGGKLNVFLPDALPFPAKDGP